MNAKDFDNENFSILSNYNAFLKHPALVNISGIRIYAIYELYKIIEFWNKTKLDNIPDSIVYLRIRSKKGYKDEVLLKACMIEEQIHKLAIFETFSPSIFMGSIMIFPFINFLILLIFKILNSFHGVIIIRTSEFLIAS